MTREEAIADIKHSVNWAKENDERWCDGVEVGSLELALEALKQPEQKNGKKFIEIVVEYPAICPYPEYEGKPYFSIRYEENGEKIEGFGTYKPEVLSEYIREYFMGEKKGKWIDARDHCGEFLCSNCHETNINNSYKYCPHCGAKMEEEE